MAQPGWYPDSSGRMGHYRFWNGNAWSDVTPPPTTSPKDLPPSHARPTHLPQAHAAGWSRWSPHSSPRWSWPSSGR